MTPCAPWGARNEQARGVSATPSWPPPRALATVAGGECSRCQGPEEARGAAHNRLHELPQSFPTRSCGSAIGGDERITSCSRTGVGGLIGLPSGTALGAPGRGRSRGPRLTSRASLFTIIDRINSTVGSQRQSLCQNRQSSEITKLRNAHSIPVAHRMRMSCNILLSLSAAVHNLAALGHAPERLFTCGLHGCDDAGGRVAHRAA